VIWIKYQSVSSGEAKKPAEAKKSKKAKKQPEADEPAETDEPEEADKPAMECQNRTCLLWQGSLAG